MEWPKRHLHFDSLALFPSGERRRGMDLHFFQTYGLTGLLIGGVLALLYRLIDRGFTFRVPSRGRERKRP
jgi:hypothetical protein